MLIQASIRRKYYFLLKIVEKKIFFKALIIFRATFVHSSKMVGKTQSESDSVLQFFFYHAENLSKSLSIFIRSVLDG